MIPSRSLLVSSNQTPLDWAGNQRRIEAMLHQARAEGASLLVLPELCTTGYGCEDAFLGPGRRRARAPGRCLRSCCLKMKGMVVSIGMPVRRRGGLYNTACVVANGSIAGFAAKEHLAGEGLHYEPRWFKPWPNHQVVGLERDGQSYPFGDVFFDFSGVRIGFEICQTPGGTTTRGARRPRDGHHREPQRQSLRLWQARGSRTPGARGLTLDGGELSHANLLGNEAGRVIYDGGCYIAQNGKMLAKSPRLTFNDSVLTTAVIDVEASRTEQVRTTSFRADRSDPGAKRISVDSGFLARRCSAASRANRHGRPARHTKKRSSHAA